eukprot:NODE_4978_length_1824_cov_20.724808.p1 GENE.NODE_4978_length_1824_cov_20.724808~~NODE_4978_length_1824_cov_20.724808.p1  ORF type:complete len:451 (+),score=52.69 NODE_4978_length_1824_cov_20.724808:99-1355(+)
MQRPASYVSRPDVCDAEEIAHRRSGGARPPWRTEGGATDFPRTCLSENHASGSGGSQPEVATLPVSTGKHGKGQRGGCKCARDKAVGSSGHHAAVRAEDNSRCKNSRVTLWSSRGNPILCKNKSLPAAPSTSYGGQRCRKASAPPQTLREDHGFSAVASPAYGGITTAVSQTPRADTATHRDGGPQVLPSAVPGGHHALRRGTPSRSRRACRKAASTPELRRVARCANKIASVLHTAKPVAEAQEPRGVDKGGGRLVNVSDASHLTMCSMEDSLGGIKEEPVEAAAAGVQSQPMPDGAWFAQGGALAEENGCTAARDAAQTMPAVKREPASPTCARPGLGAHSPPIETTGQRDVNAWLRSIDGGFLQVKYEQALLQLFDDVSQIAALYANRSQDFFEDVAVTDAAHKTSFRAAIDALC